jgi:hypothetical protein
MGAPLQPQELRRLGCPFNPLTGRYRVPDKGTLRAAYAKVDPVAITAAGYGRLAALTRPEPTRLGPVSDRDHVAGAIGPRYSGG